jgi:EAL domain-containing protein (putative c-di-GMP-specific phosphodiesterase class I)
MIYKGFQQSMIDDCTNAFNAQTIANEIQKSLKKKHKNGFVAIIDISNISYIEEQYGIHVRNHILRKIVEKLDTYLISHGFENTLIGRYLSVNFLLIFNNVKSEKHLRHSLTGFCKEIRNDGIFKIEIKASSAVIEKSYDENVKNIILKLINMVNNIENDLQDILKPNEFDILVRNAVNSQNFEFAYHALRTFENIYENPRFFNVNAKLSIDRYGILPVSQISQSVKKNGYEIKFDQLMISVLLNEIKLILSKYPDLIFIIKISAVSFRNRGFFIFLRELLKEAQIKSSNIYFSFSEKKIYDEFERFRMVIEEYKELGFGVVFEQFGTGNIGTEYLKHGIKFDIASFDMEFVKNISDKNYFEILKSLIDITKTFGIKTLIKFIDKESMLYILKEAKPNFVQGFLLDRPKSIKDF